MADAIYYPKELGEVFDRALDRCFGLICTGDEDSVAFLVIMTLEGAIIDQRVAVEALHGYFEPLGNPLDEHQSRIMIYAYAVVGEILLKGKMHKAVLIEAAENENDEAMILAHRYKFAGRTRKRLKLLGNLEVVGMRESRLSEHLRKEAP